MSDVQDLRDEVAVLAEAIQADFAVAGNVIRVFYGSGAVPDRPAGAEYVDWVGATDPAAKTLQGDHWIPTA